MCDLKFFNAVLDVTLFLDISICLSCISNTSLCILSLLVLTFDKGFYFLLANSPGEVTAPGTVGDITSSQRGEAACCHIITGDSRIGRAIGIYVRIGILHIHNAHNRDIDFERLNYYYLLMQ